MSRTIVIEREGTRLSSHHKQLQLLDSQGAMIVKAPVEDLTCVLIEAFEYVVTGGALRNLAEAGVALVICDRRKMPSGIMLPTVGHHEMTGRINAQIAMSLPRQKRAWQQLVQAKIRGQSANLPHNERATARLLRLSREVRSGDPSNLEAQAARIYWAAVNPEARFRRDPVSTNDAQNMALNYGYAIVRAVIAQNLVATGLSPAIGLFHSSKSNPWALADDLIEPFRPIVDRYVFAADVTLGVDDRLDSPTRRSLVGLLEEAIMLPAAKQTLKRAVEQLVGSLSNYVQSQTDTLDVPF